MKASFSVTGHDVETGIYISYLVTFMSVAILIAGVPLVVATVLGLIVSVFQATTQIQDQTLSQTIKIVAIVVVLLFLGGSLFSPLLVNTQAVFNTISKIGR